MRSTFMGLEASKRGLFTQQSALYTTGHNISNANTEGYSRQRVGMAPTLGYPGIGLNAPKTPGFIGTGVEATAVERIRDKFVDTQYRQETSKLGYWSAKSQSITQVEDILKEPSDYGLAESLNEFWNSLQDLNVRPKDGGARAVVVQRAIAVTDSFHYMHNSIQQIRENTAAEIGVLLKDANSVLKQIAEINFQIQSIEPNGYMPNDLYDARDNLIDQLSTYFPIDVSYTKSGGNSLSIAEGSVTIKLKLNGKDNVTLVEGNKHAELCNDGTDSTLADGVTPTKKVTGLIVKGIDDPEVNININAFNDVGKYKSLVDSYGYAATDNSEKGFLPEMLKKLDVLAKAFAEEFNKIHSEGTDLSGVTGREFFVINKDSTDTSINAGNITVSQAIIDDPNLIAASDSEQVLDAEGKPDSSYAEPGNGNNALKLANMKFNSLKALDDVSAQSYFEGLIGQLGVDGQQASRLQYNAETLQQAVQERRDSVSSVSLDEEMTNMITFQKAYNANARMITVIDETLDKIINGMGRVGL